MIKYEIHRKRKEAIWLEVEKGDTWAWLVHEVQLTKGQWDRQAMKVPIDGLRNAVAKVTIHHEVGA